MQAEMSSNGEVKYDRHSSESDERISNVLPIRRRNRVQCNTCFKTFHSKGSLVRHMKNIHHEFSSKISKKGGIEKICDGGYIQCKTCFKSFHSKGNLVRHMKNIHREFSSKISKKGTIKKICDMCKDEILENNVDARTTVVKAQTNVDNAKKRITEICTIFEVAEGNLMDAERTFQAAQTNVISHRQNFDKIHAIFKDAQKIVADAEITLVDAQTSLHNAEINTQNVKCEIDDDTM